MRVLSWMLFIGNVLLLLNGLVLVLLGEIMYGSVFVLTGIVFLAVRQFLLPVSLRSRR